MQQVIPALNVDAGIDEILTAGGVDLKEIKSAVWSHWHWDHTGDMSKFPSSTEVVVGPGFKESFMPGYPVNANALTVQADFEGREVREIAFANGFMIGGFQAHDFFGDGSFYLLNVPGHAVGHMSGLARTTEDTFVFMGGDICVSVDDACHVFLRLHDLAFWRSVSTNRIRAYAREPARGDTFR